jgi:fucose-1-phosphate guanylyltransferase
MPQYKFFLLVFTSILDFWDVVVITAIDDAQKEYYEQQIQVKLSRREIPRCTKYCVFFFLGLSLIHELIRYHVIPDPKGVKIGCGGATLYVLQFLEKEYGPKFENCRHFTLQVLMI